MDGDMYAYSWLESGDKIADYGDDEEKSKRQKGSGYKMNSGTWEQEMDIFESFFKGKTVEEIEAWNAKFCSDLNGRPLTAASTKDADVAKFSALTDEEKTVNDAISGATMSLTDPHGDIIAAIRKAVANAVPMRDVKSIAKIGLGVNVMPRLGPGKDDQDVPCYSLNTAVAAVCYDADGKVVDMFYFPLIVTNYPDWMPIVGGQKFIFFSPIFNFADAAVSCSVISAFIFCRKELSEISLTRKKNIDNQKTTDDKEE